MIIYLIVKNFRLQLMPELKGDKKNNRKILKKLNKSF